LRRCAIDALLNFGMADAGPCALGETPAE